MEKQEYEKLIKDFRFHVREAYLDAQDLYFASCDDVKENESNWWFEVRKQLGQME